MRNDKKNFEVTKEKKKKKMVIISANEKGKKQNKMYYVLGRVFWFRLSVFSLNELKKTKKRLHKTTIKINGLTKSIMQINLFLSCMRVVGACATLGLPETDFLSLSPSLSFILLALHTVCVFVRKCLGIYRNKTLLLP